MIEWKGLFANTPYSSANNKTQGDAVVGMQDTIYVTGPGYGGYEANVRVHNASGAVVALIPVSGGGGALSAPAPVRILDDSTTYSYSLEVVRGAVPSGDPDKIVIRIIGGASKRYPGQASTLPDGSTSFAGPVRAQSFLDADGNDIGTVAPKTRFASLWDSGVQIPANQTIGSYIDSQGVLHTAGGWIVSAMIPLVAGQTVYLTTKNTAPVFAGAYFLANGSPAGSDPRYNEYNTVPAGVTGMRINLESSWTSDPIVLVMEPGTAKQKIQFLGDSITRGFGVGITKPFPETAGDILGVDVINSGVDGSTLANGVGASNPMVLRFGEIDLSADAHVITYGTNDCRYGTLLGTASDTVDSTFYGAYLKIIDYIRKYAPQSRIALATPAHYGAGSVGTPASGQSSQTFAAAVRDIGRLKSCPVVDLDGECSIDLRLKAHQIMYGDEGHDLHFNQNGYTGIGQYVAARLRGFGVV